MCLVIWGLVLQNQFIFCVLLHWNTIKNITIQWTSKSEMKNWLEQKKNWNTIKNITIIPSVVWIRGQLSLRSIFAYIKLTIWVVIFRSNSSIQVCKEILYFIIVIKGFSLLLLTSIATNCWWLCLGWGKFVCLFQCWACISHFHSTRGLFLQ